MKPLVVSRACRSFAIHCYMFICLIGLISQVGQISRNYFRFEIVSDIKIDTPFDEIADGLHLCLLHHQVFNWTKLSIMRPSESSRLKYKSRENHLEFRKKFNNLNLTLNQVFEITYDPHNIISKCYTRQFEENVNHCTMSKFVINDYTCYRIQLAEESKTNKAVYGFTKRDNVMMHVETNPDLLENVTIVHPFLKQRNKLPWAELFMTNHFDIDTVQRSHSFFFDLSSQTIRVKRLEYPYRDDCVDYHKFGSRDQYHRVSSCANDISNRKLGTVSTMHLFETGNNYKLDIEQPEHILVEQATVCFQENPNPDCDNNLTLTKMVVASSKNPGLSFSLTMSNEPSIKVESHPDMNNIDYITFVLGALGSWFGFSFLGLGPAKWLVTKEEQVLKQTNVKSTQESHQEQRATKVQISQLKNVIALLQRQQREREISEIEFKQEIALKFDVLEQKLNSIK